MSGAQREMRSDELVEAMENLHQYPRLIAERAYAAGLADGKALAPTPPDALDVCFATTIVDAFGHFSPSLFWRCDREANHDGQHHSQKPDGSECYWPTNHTPARPDAPRWYEDVYESECRCGAIDPEPHATDCTLAPAPPDALREAAQALLDEWDGNYVFADRMAAVETVIEALRAALAQPRRSSRE